MVPLNQQHIAAPTPPRTLTDETFTHTKEIMAIRPFARKSRRHSSTWEHPNRYVAMISHQEAKPKGANNCTTRPDEVLVPNTSNTVETYMREVSRCTYIVVLALLVMVSHYASSQHEKRGCSSMRTVHRHHCCIAANKSPEIRTATNEPRTCPNR